MANIYSKKEMEQLITNFYDTKDLKELIKEVKKYLKEEKTEEEICELIGGTAWDKFISNNEEIVYFTIGKTRFVGNIVKKLLLPSYGCKLQPNEIKKVKQDIMEESVIVTVYNNGKEITADTSCIVEYKDGYKEKILYEIAKEKI